MLENLWQELDQYHNMTMDCSRDVAYLKRFIEKSSIWIFGRSKFGLWSSTDVDIGKKEMPSRNEVISILPSEKIGKGSF